MLTEKRTKIRTTVVVSCDYWEEAMHDSVKLGLEEYLHTGVLTPQMQEHVRNCGSCREEIETMRIHAGLFRTLKAPSEMDPGGAFYARVMNRIEVEVKPSVWSLFGESQFARRLVYASATFLVLLSSYVISAHPDDEVADGAPEAILAGGQTPEPVTMDPQKDREVILANLATWGGGGEEPQDFQ